MLLSAADTLSVTGVDVLRLSVSSRVCGLSQACKPQPGSSGGAHGSGQSLPPHVSPLDQAEDQSSPAKRKRTASPAKVCAPFAQHAADVKTAVIITSVSLHSSEFYRVLEQQFSTASDS